MKYDVNTYLGDCLFVKMAKNNGKPKNNAKVIRDVNTISNKLFDEDCEKTSMLDDQLKSEKVQRFFKNFPRASRNSLSQKLNCRRVQILCTYVPFRRRAISCKQHSKKWRYVIFASDCSVMPKSSKNTVKSHLFPVNSLFISTHSLFLPCPHPYAVFRSSTFLHKLQE